MAERRDLLATQAVGAAAGAAGQADVFGLQRLPAVPQELGEAGAIVAAALITSPFSFGRSTSK